MDVGEVSSEIFNEIEKAIDLGYDRLYMNVDDLCNGFGFLRVLAMKGMKFIIVYDGTFALEACYQILRLLEQSEYEIKDFTAD